VINRSGQDNIQVIDPAQNYATIHQYSTGNGSNPYDIAFVSATKAYVSRYDRADVLIMNPNTGVSPGSISLAMFADADGLPEMDHMIRVGRWLFVSIQRLNRNNFYTPTGPGLVAVIDTQADTVVDVDPATPGKQAITLAFANPVTAIAFDRANTRLLVGCEGAYGVADGGVAMFEPVFFQSLGAAIGEAALGGDIGDLEWNGATHSYAIVSDASYDTKLVAWNPTTGLSLGTVFNPGGFSLTDCAVNDRGELWVCDSNPVSPGLYCYSTATDLRIAGPLDTGLPPYAMCFDQTNTVLDAPGESAAGAVELSAPWPHPARESVRFTLRLPQAGEARIEVLDLAGRHVADIGRGAMPAGVSTWGWSLATDDGARVAPGVYLVRASGAAWSAVRRCVVVR
jgi:hypothetical protein